MKASANVSSIWKTRAIAYWKEQLPYFRYVISSGFLLFCFLAVITISFYYANWIRQLPSDFPVVWAAVLILTPVLYASSIRTFIHPADILFLMPLQERMKPYWSRSYTYSCAFQFIYVSIALISVWPLYLHASSGMVKVPLLLMLLILLVMKLFVVKSSWREGMLQSSNARIICKIIRLIMIAAAVYILFAFPLVKAAPLTGLMFIAFYYAIRIPTAHAVNWEYLIQQEQAHQSRMTLFLSWFADVPKIGGRIRTRTIVSRLMGRVRFERSSTYTFLYGITFARSELLSMWIRLMAIGMIFEWLVPSAGMKFMIYIGFLFAVCVQVSALKSYHTYLYWLHIYPLPMDLHKRSAAKVILHLRIASALLMLIPFVFIYS